MVLVAFLGSGLGSKSRKLLRHKQMPRSVGEGQIRKGRERPRLWLPRVGGRAGRSRPLPGEPEQNQITSRSVWYLELI